MTNRSSSRDTPRQRLYWGGFSDGKLHTWAGAGDYGGYTRVAVFVNHREAKRQYQDVRRIEIREVK